MNCNSIKEKVLPFQVKLIRENEIGRESSTAWREKDIVIEECRYVFPIPLSGEILRLNGFSEDGKFSNDEVKIDYVFYDGFNFNIKTKLMELQVVLWNVHELQNVLRLCGLIELANNFRVEEKENGEE